LTSAYFTVDAAPMCARCKDAVQRAASPVREWSLVARAGVFGLGAAIAGAIIYYGVIAITDLEIGFVAILIGYMVGWAVRKGTRGRGGRRLQVLAVALTYFSVAMAYLPLAFKSTMDDKASTSSGISKRAADSTRPAASEDTTVATATDSTAAPTAATDSGAPRDTLVATPMAGADFAKGLGALLLLTLSLPVLVVFGSMPSGILSAIIIGVGLRQAWRMTGVPEVKVHGPYKVGAKAAAPAAP
jgi:hypothetical protein